jgi:hypothetical protein
MFQRLVLPPSSGFITLMMEAVHTSEISVYFIISRKAVTFI